MKKILLILVGLAFNCNAMDMDSEINYYNQICLREKEEIKKEIEKIEQEKVNILQKIGSVSQNDATQVVALYEAQVKTYDELIAIYKEKEKVIEECTKNVVASIRTRETRDLNR